jgi:hypothetical protein
MWPICFFSSYAILGTDLDIAILFGKFDGYTFPHVCFHKRIRLQIKDRRHLSYSCYYHIISQNAHLPCTKSISNVDFTEFPQQKRGILSS